MRPISENRHSEGLTPSKGPFRLSPAHIIPLSFLLAIAVGTLLLLLPASSAKGVETDFLTALFTSTTSVCVTGLVVVDTYAHWSLFGKIVILILIQLGGLGIVSAISMVMLFLRRRFSLRSRTLLLDALNLDPFWSSFSEPLVTASSSSPASACCGESGSPFSPRSPLSATPDWIFWGRTVSAATQALRWSSG